MPHIRRSRHGYQPEPVPVPKEERKPIAWKTEEDKIFLIMERGGALENKLEEALTYENRIGSLKVLIYVDMEDSLIEKIPYSELRGIQEIEDGFILMSRMGESLVHHDANDILFVNGLQSWASENRIEIIKVYQDWREDIPDYLWDLGWFQTRELCMEYGITGKIGTLELWDYLKKNALEIVENHLPNDLEMMIKGYILGGNFGETIDLPKNYPQISPSESHVGIYDKAKQNCALYLLRGIIEQNVQSKLQQ